MLTLTDWRRVPSKIESVKTLNQSAKISKFDTSEATCIWFANTMKKAKMKKVGKMENSLRQAPTRKYSPFKVNKSYKSGSLLVRGHRAR